MTHLSPCLRGLAACLLSSAAFIACGSSSSDGGTRASAGHAGRPAAAAGAGAGGVPSVGGAGSAGAAQGLAGANDAGAGGSDGGAGGEAGAREDAGASGAGEEAGAGGDNAGGPRVVTCTDLSLRRGCVSLADSLAASTSNPNGPWSYGWSSSLDSEFQRFNLYGMGAYEANDWLRWWSSTELPLTLGDHLPGIGLNDNTEPVSPYGTFTIGAGRAMGHPGNDGEYAIARFTPASAGELQVQVTFAGLSGTGGSPLTTTDVHLRFQSSDVLSGTLNLEGSANEFCAAALVTAQAGDVIDFAVGNGQNDYKYDSTAIDAVICPAD